MGRVQPGGPLSSMELDIMFAQAKDSSSQSMTFKVPPVLYEKTCALIHHVIFPPKFLVLQGFLEALRLLAEGCGLTTEQVAVQLGSRDVTVSRSGDALHRSS